MPGVAIKISTEEARLASRRLKADLRSLGVETKLTEQHTRKLENRLKKELGMRRAKETVDRLTGSLKLSRMEVARLQTRMGDFGGAVATVRGKMSSLAKQAMSLKTAMVGMMAAFVMKKAISSFTNFETALVDMSKVTKQSLGVIREEIMELPPILGSATELVQGYYQVISAGVKDPVKAMELLIIASKSGKAAHLAQSEVIKALTKMMAGFEGQIKSVTDASDLLFAMEKEGQTTFQELVPVIGDLSKVSSVAKISHEEMAAAMALITQTSGTTSEAATKYRAMVIQLARGNENLTKVLKALNKETMIQMIAEEGLASALKKVTTEAKAQGIELVKLFRSAEGMIALTALAANGFETFASTLDAVRERAGSTDDAFERWSKTFAAVTTVFGNTVGKFMIELGEDLVPTVTDALEGMGDWMKDNKEEILGFFESLGTALRAAGNAAAYFGSTIGMLPGWIGDLKAAAGLQAGGVIDFSEWFFATPEELRALVKKYEDELETVITLNERQIQKLKGQIAEARGKVLIWPEDQAKRERNIALWQSQIGVLQKTLDTLNTEKAVEELAKFEKQNKIVMDALEKSRVVYEQYLEAPKKFEPDFMAAWFADTEGAKKVSAETLRIRKKLTDEIKKLTLSERDNALRIMKEKYEFYLEKADDELAAREWYYEELMVLYKKDADERIKQDERASKELFKTRTKELQTELGGANVKALLAREQVETDIAIAGLQERNATQLREAEERMNIQEEMERDFYERLGDISFDFFERLFSGQIRSFGQALEEMTRMFTSTLAAWVAEAAKREIKLQLATSMVGPTGGLSGAGMVGAAGFAGATMYLMHIREEAIQRNKEAAARRKVWKEEVATAEEFMGRILGAFTKLEQQLRPAEEQMHKYIHGLERLGASSFALQHAEEQRLEVMRRVREELERDFARPLENIIAQLSMTDIGYEEFTLRNWYEEQIDYARQLGEESVKLLREAYELSRQHLYEITREVLQGLAKDYRAIVETAGMTPVEAQVYAAERGREEVDWGPAEDAIKQLGADITGLGVERRDLLGTMDSLNRAVDKANVGYEDAVQEFMDVLGHTTEAQREGVRDVMTRSHEDIRKLFKILLRETYTDIEGREYTRLPVGAAKTAQRLADMAIITRREMSNAEEAARIFGATLPTELAEVGTAITDLESDLAVLVGTLDETQLLEFEAYLTQMETLRKGVQKEWDTLMRSLTLTDLEISFYNLNQWYEEQAKNAKALGLSLIELSDLMGLQADKIVDSFIKPIEDAWQSFAYEMRAGALAPVQSLEMVEQEYARLRTAAVGGDVEAYKELLGFLKAEYLPFMKTYGAEDYASTFERIMADAESIKDELKFTVMEDTLTEIATLLGTGSPIYDVLVDIRDQMFPTAQWGGLATRPTLVGESGPEWVVPTYEPQRSSFLQTVGLEPNQIGRAIAAHIVPALTGGTNGGRVTVHVYVDGREVGDTVAQELRTNTNLIEAVSVVASR